MSSEASNLSEEGREDEWTILEERGRKVKGFTFGNFRNTGVQKFSVGLRRFQIHATSAVLFEVKSEGQPFRLSRRQREASRGFPL